MLDRVGQKVNGGNKKSHLALPTPPFPLDRILRLHSINKIYRNIGSREGVDAFLTSVLAELNITCEAKDCGVGEVPTSGPVVISSNHPFGGIEGIILASLVRSVRTDVKVLANHILGLIPELREIFILIDPFDRPDSVRRNVKGLRQALEWLEKGGVLIVFPAGEVAHWRAGLNRVIDPEWFATAATLVRKSGAAVVPVHVEGRNSALFHTAGLLHPSLRTALLPSELLNRRNTTVRLHFGREVPSKRLSTFSDSRTLTAFLRFMTYAAGAGEGIAMKKEGPSEGSRGRVAMKPVAPPVNRNTIDREVEALPKGQVLLEHGQQAVIVAGAHQIPKVLCEIGRLREITFREAGEGTGRPSDIDRYDLYYLHLFLWDRDKKAIAGAYRLGPAGEMLSRFGPQGLYTSTLFRYRRGFFDHVRDGLEMGRSFVHPDYQKQYTSLLLLWRGIGRYVACNPGYRKLFGPVTISNRYGPLSRQLMVAFLRLKHFAPEVASLVRPRAPLSGDRLCAAEAQKMANKVENIEELSSVIADIEPDGKDLPVLLRQYLKLGGKLLGFNVDYSFAEALDGLILVDLMDTEERILERYMGVEESKAFLKFHIATS